MGRCAKDQEWFAYYKENMSRLNLPVPDGWFATQTDVLARIGAMLAALKQVGGGATIAQLATKIPVIDKILVIGAFYAAGYLGAMIGSAYVATHRYASCGMGVDDVIYWTLKSFPEVPRIVLDQIREHPEVIGKQGSTSAAAYKYRIMQ